MIIIYSRYYLPFIEPPKEGFHYIPLDFKFDIERGMHDGHVLAYRNRVIRVFDPLSNTFIVNDPNKPKLVTTPLIKNNVMTQEFLADLYFNAGVKAAGKRLGITPSKNFR